MNKILALSLLLITGCAHVKTASEYRWTTEYKDGQKLITYVLWFDDSTGCVGGPLYVPAIKNVYEIPMRIIRTDDGKEFHLCSESQAPGAYPYNPFSNTPIDTVH